MAKYRMVGPLTKGPFEEALNIMDGTVVWVHANESKPYRTLPADVLFTALMEVEDDSQMDASSLEDENQCSSVAHCEKLVADG